jgi:hypothetical protein
MNGALVPKADTKYTINIIYDESIGYGRCYRGTVTKQSFGGSYAEYTNKTTYTTDIKTVMKTYYDNRSVFVYNTRTPYSFKNPNSTTNIPKWQTNGKYHIDCSTFVQLATRGIPYQESIYYDSKLSPYILGKYAYGFVMDNTISDNDRFASDQARYCIEEGWQLDISVTDQTQWKNLQTGDLVFWAKRVAEGSDEVAERYMQVGHVAIINTVSADGKVTTMEVSTPTNTVLNRSLSNNYPEKLLFFARPRR